MKDDLDLSKLIEAKGKKRINSKAKGGRFERKIADKLNERFKTKDFCRTPGSGAFATTHNLPEHLKIYGDLITPKDFKFIIECKSGYNKEGISNLFNSNSIFSDMIAQATRDSVKCSKFFLLIIGQDRKDEIVVTNYPVNQAIEWYTIGSSIDYLEFNRFNAEPLYIMKLGDLLNLDDTNFF